jgi:hypothetical protein
MPLPLRIRTFRGSALALALASATSSALAAGVSPTKATPAQRELAQKRFLRGKELQGAGKCDAALAELQASLDVVASPNTHLVIARCQREVGKLVVAYVELGRVAVEAKELAAEDARYEKTAEAANAERADLALKVGFVEVKIANADPNATLRVAGEEVARSGWGEPFPVMPGDTEAVLEAPGRGPVRKSAAVAAGQRVALELDGAEGAPPPPPSVAAVKVTTASSSPSSLRPLAYVAGGVAVVGLGTFAVAGLLSRGTYSDLESGCPGGACPRDRESDISRGKTEQAIANVGLAIGLVGAAAGVSLFILSRPGDGAAPAPAAARFAPPGARLVGGPASLRLEGTF